MHNTKISVYLHVVYCCLKSHINYCMLLYGYNYNTYCMYRYISDRYTGTQVVHALQ